MRHLLTAALALSTLSACSEPAPPAAPPPAVAATSTAASPARAPVLTAQGYDGIRLGVAPAAAGYGLADDGAYRDACRIFTSARLPGLAALVEDGVIRRVTLLAASARPSRIRTERGIGVGSTEPQVRAAYRPVGEEAHKYSAPPAKNLYWGEEGSPEALRFEIGEDGRVSALHAGESPWLQYVEGCS